MKSRVTYRDRVPIKPIPRADRVFDHHFIDCLGPLFPSEGSKPKFNYAFVAVDSFSWFPFCVPLKNLTAKSVCIVIIVAIYGMLFLYFVRFWDKLYQPVDERI